jgi:hypothetical protein
VGGVSGWTPLKWELPNAEIEDASVAILDMEKAVNVDVISRDLPCTFLSNPKSANWYPTNDKTDPHKECLKFHAATTAINYNQEDSYGTSSVTFDIPAKFSRFQTYVGMADVGDMPVGEVQFNIYLDGELTTSITCEPTSLDFGTQEGFQTTVVRNMCSFDDCDPDSVQELAGNDDACLMPYQPVDVVIKDKQELTLETRTKNSCRTLTFPADDGTTTERTVGCDGNLHAAWASSTFTNAVAAGEESQVEYTTRMLWGMHASIFQPCWIIFIGMDMCILLIDTICMVLVFWGLWYWAAYKRSRQKMFTAWAITFVGPLLISCVPIRLFIPWDKADAHIDGYLIDFERRYNLQTAEDMTLESCKVSAGEGPPRGGRGAGAEEGPPAARRMWDGPPPHPRRDTLTPFFADARARLRRRWHRIPDGVGRVHVRS